ncbi:hypothetical protein HOK68_04435 [Candidatus Woesearchaeota archaeon]|jgi:NOL1/NOP2/fmu family ribosome biogenesis protein|nr:hypothetical protein [Candidatus Woesearchaeota archaeon]MBT4387229.1 hypothetical protein [Candidatus Woesearchaeota archaeon]MBT4596230.1 hypothetical protein [Candidatus Woesearchaeota archaeon]MBT5741547.1 hypothetical protein [Candidatus Woesearchaeota archaeon]MBT6505998.1 hypothetical protein [Candidatus Woesearchaeota archaeon]
MIRNLKKLNSKEKKNILNLLKENYGFNKDLNEYTFFINKNDKINLINTETYELIDFDDYRVDSIGVYFGELINNTIRLSIEGSQLIGPSCNRNIIELNENQLNLWIRGKDVEIDKEGNDFFLIKYKEDYIACGKLKNKILLNFVSKARTISAKIEDECKAKI